jgi:hypothetical protein
MSYPLGTKIVKTGSKRKTVDVEWLRKKANEALEVPGKYANAEWRHGVAYLLEIVLFETKNYKGFSFQDGNAGRTDASKKNYF